MGVTCIHVHLVQALILLYCRHIVHADKGVAGVYQTSVSQINICFSLFRNQDESCVNLILNSGYFVLHKHEVMHYILACLAVNYLLFKTSWAVKLSNM